MDGGKFRDRFIARRKEPIFNFTNQRVPQRAWSIEHRAWGKEKKSL
jgi:hypothetical protein